MEIFRPQFVAFDETRAVRIYKRDLPHWRQEQATYFVTFRLGDSLPQGVHDQSVYEKRLWLEARGIRVDAEGCAEESNAYRQVNRTSFANTSTACFTQPWTIAAVLVT